MEETKRKQQEIRNLIMSAAIIKTLNNAHQNRHIRNSGDYIEGRSYLYDGVNPKALIDKYHGTGQIRSNNDGGWVNKEFISLDENIGVYINKSTGEEMITNSFSIHYCKRGAHIVPSRPSRRR